MTETQTWLVIAALLIAVGILLEQIGLANLAIYGHAARKLYGIWKGKP